MTSWSFLVQNGTTRRLFPTVLKIFSSSKFSADFLFNYLSYFLYLNIFKKHCSHHNFLYIILCFLGKNYDLIKHSRFNTHQLCIFSWIRCVQAYGYNINQTTQFGRNISFINETTVSIRIKPRSSTVTLHKLCYLLNNIPSNSWFTKTTKNNFIEQFGIANFFYIDLCIRFILLIHL